MQTKDNQRKIYIRSTKTWVPVTEEVYLEYYRPVWRTQKAMQKAGQCYCPKSKLWLCDDDCAMCEYRAAGNTVSLVAPMQNGLHAVLPWSGPAPRCARRGAAGRAVFEGRPRYGRRRVSQTSSFRVQGYRRTQKD